MLTYDEYQRRVAPLGAVELRVTGACNNHCTFCGSGWINRREMPAHPPLDGIYRRMAEAYEQGARRLTYQGGEPTLRRDLDEITQHAHRIGFEHVSVFTNARIASSELGARWLMSFGLSDFHVSIQGGTAAAHDASVQAHGAFAQTVAGARRLIEAGYLVFVNAVLTVHLLDDLDAFVALMLDLRPAEVGIDTLKPAGLLTLDTQAHPEVLPIYRPGELTTFAGLNPKFSLYSASLRRAVETLRNAGIPTHLVAFPPCLLPGAEYLVSNEPDSTLTVTENTGGVVVKNVRLGEERTKAPGCRECVYDPVCTGLYKPYVDTYGFDELRPVRVRRRPPGEQPAPVIDRRQVALMDAVRAALGDLVPASAIEPHATGCRLRLPSATVAAEGSFLVDVLPGDVKPRYKHAAGLSVSYLGSEATPEQLALVDGIVARLEAHAALYSSLMTSR